MNIVGVKKVMDLCKELKHLQVINILNLVLIVISLCLNFNVLNK